MIIGYARTSTVDQVAGFEAQLRELEAVNCKKIFQEQASSIAVRAGLEAALEFAREGDVLVVTKLDRLTRIRGGSHGYYSAAGPQGGGAENSKSRHGHANSDGQANANCPVALRNSSVK